MTIGHVHLKVRDLDRSIAFYKIIGLQLIERVDEEYAFLGGGDRHHEIALQNVGPLAPPPPPYGSGLYHVAFEVPDRQAFADIYQRVSKGGIPVIAVDHSISWSIYFSDPDGNGLEIYCDTRDAENQLWRGRTVPLADDRILEQL